MSIEWKRVRPGRSLKLLTKRVSEIIFEVPILFEYHLKQVNRELTRAFFVEP